MPVSSYEIRIKGRIGEALRAAFADLKVTTRPAETVVYGQVADQAALRGLLDRIQELGLEIVEMRQLPPDGPDAGAVGGRRPVPPA
jgi:hypothetical protein